MFLLNSCLGHFSATSSLRQPFSRSYGFNLPSSLTTLLPLACGFSPRLPVSVCGTGTLFLVSSFSRQCGFMYFATFIHSPSYFTLDSGTSLTTMALYLAENHLLGYTILLCPCFLNRIRVVLDLIPVLHRLRLLASP